MITVEYETDIPLVPELDYEAVIGRVIEEACEFERCPYETSVNVILTDNQNICQLNKQYRHLNTPTDVLSFPMLSFTAPSDFRFLEYGGAEDYFDPDSGELVLGDIVISVEKVMEQANHYGHTVMRELAFLTAHSMLHLFGYDHMSDSGAKEMERRQEAILTRINIPR